MKPIEVRKKLLDKYPNVLQTKIAYLEERNGKYYVKGRKGSHGVARSDAMKKLTNYMYKDMINESRKDS